MRSLSIRSKLLAMLLLAGIFCLAAAGLVADYNGNQALTAAILSQLTSLRDNKRIQIEEYLNRLRASVRFLSETPDTLHAVTQFSDLFHHMDEPATDPPAPELVQFYRDTFLPNLARASTGVPSLDAYLPTGRAARLLQQEYIAANPFPAETRSKLITSKSGDAYDKLHADLHPFFLAATTEFRVDDLLLVDAATGNVVYSVAKRVDFATDLRNGPYAHTGLARAFQHALDLHDVGAVWYEGFSTYPAIGMAPMAFISAPIAGPDGKIAGAIIVEISADEIDRVMTSDRHWSDVGLGKTGSAYLVGSDSHARSDDRLLIEDKPAFLRAIAAAGIDHETIARIDQFNTMILYLPINTEASRAALRGQSGTGIIRDYRNELTLSSWAPLSLPGVHWAVIADIDATEAFEPQHYFRHALLIVAASSAVVLTLVSLLWANAFLRPIREILAGVKTLGAGDDTTRIPVHGHDEFSELAQAFNSMAEQISERNTRIQEKTDEYESLLRNVYPEVVAERVKLGQTSISEAVRNVSVLVLNIGGVNALFQSTEYDTVAVMNDIINAFDEAGGRLGIEKLRTVGESYIAACSLTTPRLDHATRAVAFAEDACRILDRLRRDWNLPFDLRVGIASGDVEAGLMGRQRTIYDVWGPTMVTARRIVFEAASNAIRITNATRALLSDASGFEPMPIIHSSELGPIETFERPALPTAAVTTLEA